MLERITVLVIFYTAIMVYEVPKWKKIAVPERIVNGVLMLVVFYLSIEYVFEANLPNLNDAVSFFFLKPAKSIVESVKLPS